jgi:predicted membrane-bound mannosyltransferase
VRAFRLLLVVFGLLTVFLAARYVVTGRRQYLHWALRLLAGALVSGVVFFAVLLITRLT